MKFQNLNPRGTPTLCNFLGLIPEIVRRNERRENMERVGRMLGFSYPRRRSRTHTAQLGSETIESNLPL